jgi:molybdopterin-containing oxidoreductase family membrane subunit
MRKQNELDKSLNPKSKVPVIGPGYTFGTINDKVSAIVLLRGTTFGWIVGFGMCFMVFMLMLYSISYLLFKGVGIWGINNRIGWGFDIINFVWWIGIGHAGTLISAVLLLLHQKWRTSINRFAEAMTLFAVACAGLFPVLHLGRPWYAYFLFPYPNTLGMYFPQFRSPLEWDVFAVSTYASVSLVFWYVGLIPDLATLRDRARSWLPKTLYGIFSLGWRGSARHWSRYETIYTLLAGLSTPLVLSVHSIVSFDFSVSLIPGWHATFFPPYFVAGAIYAGFAMVLTLAIPVRWIYGLEDFITDRHLENMGKITLVTGLIVAYSYLMELFYGWYSANEYESFMVKNRLTGPYWYMYIALVVCNIIAPQFLWVKKFRTSTVWLFGVSMFVSVGMWLERYVIIVVSLHRTFLPSAWGTYSGTFWDWSLYIGTMGFFMTLLFLFIRLLPMISISEMQMLLPQAQVKEEAHEAKA